ncbi:hypothetical protein A8L34_18855 [Bacillus sp. FJAT-27264]|nr:hypothetical protein A8L34_18855 [Bacillus sp. FJAT-27264]
MNKNGQNEPGEPNVTDSLEALYQKSLRMLPLYVLVPLLFWALFRVMGYSLDWKGFGLGALGWIVALFLRGPLSLIVRKWPEERVKNVIVGSSGVLEEGIRLLLIAVTSASFSWAQSVGQGWAAIEVVYVMISVILISSLIKRTDEKAQQAKDMLMAQGNIQANPMWGILERIWASAFHIGATLVVAYNPWMVILLIPLHSGLNMIAVRLAKTSFVGTSVFIAAVGLITLAAGLLLH